MPAELADVLESIRDLGRDTTRDVKIGQSTFELRPISTEEEIECYQIACEECGGVPSLENAGLKVGPEFVLVVKALVLSRAVYTIDGVEVGYQEVLDVEGTKREVRSYLLKLLRTWPSEVLDYLFIEYNKLQVDVSKNNDFPLAHRALMSSLDQLLYANAEHLKSLSEEGKRLDSEEEGPVESGEDADDQNSTGSE